MDHKITALTVQKGNNQRVNVYLDGEFAFGLARILAAWLEVGQAISDVKIAQLNEHDSREKAYLQVLRYLEYRPRSESEIRKYLEKEKDISAEVTESVVERLHQAGLLNDDQLAQVWVENRSEFRPRSRRALAYELRRRGINQATIEQSLEQVDETEMAYRAALKQTRKLKNLGWKEFRQKLHGFLARRGFDYGTSAEAVTRLWTEIHDDELTDETNENKEV